MRQLHLFAFVIERERERERERKKERKIEVASGKVVKVFESMCKIRNEHRVRRSEKMLLLLLDNVSVFNQEEFE